MPRIIATVLPHCSARSFLAWKYPHWSETFDCICAASDRKYWAELISLDESPAKIVAITVRITGVVIMMVSHVVLLRPGSISGNVRRLCHGYLAFAPVRPRYSQDVVQVSRTTTADNSGKTRLSAIINPNRQHFAGGIAQAFNFVQIMVIEHFDRRFRGPLNIAIINQISLGRINLPFHDHIEMKRVTMQPPAFVPFGKRRQIVRGLKMERFTKSNKHPAGISTSPGVCCSNPLVQPILLLQPLRHIFLGDVADVFVISDSTSILKPLESILAISFCQPLLSLNQG